MADEENIKQRVSNEEIDEIYSKASSSVLWWQIIDCWWWRMYVTCS